MMPFLNDVPQLRTLQILARAKKKSIYLVGGFLRDYFLGEIKKDFDFAVSLGALNLAKDFAKKIRGAYVLLDEGNQCARVVKKMNAAIYTFDFTKFRDKTFEKDLKKRDFTINALYIKLEDILREDDLRPFLLKQKQAIKDIRARTIRQISSRVFIDDPLRMMRAFSLKAVLGFKIDRKTLDQIKKDRNLIKKVSYERVCEELFKIFKSPRAAATLKQMHKVGLLEAVLPQIRVMFNCAQGAYHHLNVWEHSLETVVQLEKILDNVRDSQWQEYLNENLASNRPRYALLKLAALLHDIGKPDSRREDGKKKFIFHGHEHIGKNIVRSIAKLLKISVRERHILEDMVLWHLRPGYLSNFKRPTDKAVYRYFRDTKDEAVGILLLSLADQRSTRGPLTSEKDQRHHENLCLSLIQKYFDKKKEKIFKRLINGYDLIRQLKLTPSPLFSKILSAVDEAQSLGKITTRQEALALAKKIVLK
ncbi:MAG TPA: HD domain-containing protein [Candidatus Omnitrophota bacterium]|nr:HD domain-containing protein [Candidatus Omnitrophota bacterium]HPN88388.1 HD domain-containing protein [Candidatus Omnitrophota bacterium]